MPVVLYTIITLIMIYIPIGFDITRKYIGVSEVVVWSNYFWWFDYAVTHLFTNPIHNSYLFYPVGFYYYDNILPFLLSIPLTHIFGSIVSYNIYVLTTFIVAAYGMYLLIIYILDDEYIAFVSGLIFAFCPFHFGASAGHLHTYSIFWIPFFVLFFLKMYEKPTYKNIILCSLLFAANGLTSWTIALMISLFIMIFIVINYRQIVVKSYLFPMSLFIIVSAILVSPGLYMMMINPSMSFSLGSFLGFSADILGFIVPSPFHPFLGELSRNIYSNFTGNYSENIVFIGYSVIILSIVGLTKCRENNTFRLFFVSFWVFFVISLGPILNVNGITRFTEHDLTIMLPGILTAYLPFFDMIRVPSRYNLMTMFCAAIIAGYGIKSIFIRYDLNAHKRMLICILLSVLVLFEFAAIMPSQTVKPIPDFYYNISINKDDSILELPIIRSGRDSSAPYGVAPMMLYYEYQKIHNARIFGGYYNRINPSYEKYLAQSDPYLYVLYNGFNHDIYSNPILTNCLEYLKYKYNVQYVVLHENLMSPTDLSDLVKYLGNSYSIDNSVTSDPLIIYSMEHISYDKKLLHIPTFILLGDGWHVLEDWSGAPSRWMENDAILMIDSEENRSAELSFRARSYNRPRTLELYDSEDNLIGEATISENFREIKMPIELEVGANSIRLHTPEGCDRPNVVSEGKSKDGRCLSLAFQEIKITGDFIILN